MLMSKEREKETSLPERWSAKAKSEVVCCVGPGSVSGRPSADPRPAAARVRAPMTRTV